MTKHKLLDHIPKGFERMDVVLTLNSNASDLLEKKVLHYIVRDFYIFYAKEELKYLQKKADDERYYKFYFYTREKDAQQVAYRLGINLQCLSPFYDKENILNATHKVPEPFPDSIRISPEAVKMDNLRRETKIFEHKKA